MQRRVRWALLLLCFLGFQVVPQVGAEKLIAEKLIVVVNPQAGIGELSRDEVINVYMGRQRTLAGNRTALPLDLNDGGGQGTRAHFYDSLLNKPVSEINSYWARLMFSGQGSPPRQLASVSEVRATVLENVGAIGYLPASASTDGLKVVHILEKR